MIWLCALPHSGKHAGNLYGLSATNTNIDIYSAVIFRLANGKITEAWFMADEAGLLRQIGKPLPEREKWTYRSGACVLNPISGDEHSCNVAGQSG